MKTQGKVWLIYDAERKKQTKPMSVVQAQVALLSLKNSDASQLFIWTPGWSDWVSVEQFLKSDQSYFVFQQPPKPISKDDEEEIARTLTNISVPDGSDVTAGPYTYVVEGAAPSQRQDFGYYFKDFHGGELDLSKIRKIKPGLNKKKSAATSKSEDTDAERRREMRHNLKIEVVLISKKESFRTYSLNISLSGTLLEHEIPREFLNSPFDLVVVNPFEKDPRKARLLFRAKIIGDMEDPHRLMFIEQEPEMTLKLDALLKAYVAYYNGLQKTPKKAAG